MTPLVIIPLPYLTPPLNLNDSGASRGARMEKAKVIKAVRRTAAILAKHHRLPLDVGHATVELHYRPRTNARRDTDNLVATAKPIYDGLTDYGLVKDDVPQYMSKPEPVLHRKGKTPELWLEISTTDTPKELPE